MNLLVDATNLLTKGYYAFVKENEKTGGIFCFVNIMQTIIEKHHPQTIHFCFDTSGLSWRKELYPDYKVTRKEKPEHLPYQLDLARKIMKEVGLSVYEHPATEADDLIASLCYKLDGQKTILSSDKDFFQLLNDNINYVRYTRQGYEVVTANSFYQKYKFFPEYFADYLALAGDTGDNIPGAKGIGPVGATKLVQEYHTVANMISQLERGNGLEKVALSKKNVEMSYKLVKLAMVVGLQPQRGEYKISDVRKIVEVVKENN